MLTPEKKMVIDQSDEERTTAWVYRTIKELIIEGELPAGCNINQLKLASDLGVSRTPVINALHKLETENLVDSVRQKGFFVHKMTVKELYELFTLREALDAIVVDDIVGRITPSQLDVLANIFAPFTDDWDDQSLDAYRKADQVFHNTMLEMCDNQLAKKLNETFQVLSRTYRAGLVRKPEETINEHQKILESLRKGDAEAAREAVVRHITITKELLRATIDRLRRLGINPDTLAVQDISQEVLSK